MAASGIKLRFRSTSNTDRHHRHGNCHISGSARQPLLYASDGCQERRWLQSIQQRLNQLDHAKSRSRRRIYPNRRYAMIRERRRGASASHLARPAAVQWLASGLDRTCARAPNSKLRLPYHCRRSDASLARSRRCKAPPGPRAGRPPCDSRRSPFLAFATDTSCTFMRSGQIQRDISFWNGARGSLPTPNRAARNARFSGRSARKSLSSPSSPARSIYANSAFMSFQRVSRAILIGSAPRRSPQISAMAWQVTS